MQRQPAMPGAGQDPMPRTCSDGHRALISMIVALVATTLAILGVRGAQDSGGIGPTVVFLLLGWNVFAIVYVLLTHRTFSGRGVDEFEARMGAREAYRSSMWKRLNPGGDGPMYAVQSAIVAFAVVLVLPHIPAINIHAWLLVPVTLSILLSCWALSIASYALHYAQKNLVSPGLEFPGTRTNAYADYLYFSIAVATTFGATDVNIVTPSMRRVVNLHTILTFIYNSVIVALLAALLIR